MKRSKGGQPGNLNALKTGIYSTQLRSMETNDLSALAAEGLDSEIAMLRVLMARTLELGMGVEDIDTAVKLLGALSVASGRLSGMLRTQKLLSDKGSDDTMTAISQALADVMKELEIN